MASDLSTLFINQVNHVPLHIYDVHATSYSQTDDSNFELFQLPLTKPPFPESIMAFSSTGPSSWVNGGGAGGTVSITGANGVALTPSPLVNIGVVGLVADMIDDVNNNVSLGHNNLTAIAGAINNTAFGNSALAAVTTGTSNTAIGYQSGLNSINGINNTFVGKNAGSQYALYNNSVFIGADTDASRTGLSNIIVIGRGASTDISNSIIMGIPGMRMGIGISNPGSALSFKGEMRQTGINASVQPNSVTDLVKGQGVSTLITDTSLPFQQLSQFTIQTGLPTGATVQTSTIVKVDILLNSNIGGTTINSAYASSSIMGVYDVGSATYSIYPAGGSPSIGFQNAGSPALVATANWVLVSSVIQIQLTWNANSQNVSYVVNYEVFSAQT